MEEDIAWRDFKPIIDVEQIVENTFESSKA